MRITTMVAVAALGLSAGMARAGTLDVINYVTPDNDAFNSVTTPDLDGNPGSTYSYYTGPIVFDLKGGGSILVYCADLDHWLSVPTVYQPSPLGIDGLGNTLTSQQKSEMGWLVNVGLTAWKHGDQAEATAVQAAIWDVEYQITSTVDLSAPDGLIQSDLKTLMTEVADHENGPAATALIPVGQDWWQNSGASQQMLTSVPEPASIALMGVGLLGRGFAKRRLRLKN
jgi:hypothetical protein